ncbi:MAG: tripartite tricarboxylate transporter permease [Burkholderiales bacterium]|nr:tripartite tricarboxylate transporter permease [Burkholderiales bacterium]
MLDGYISAFEYIFSGPLSILLIVGGTIWGILFGAVPGLTGIVGVALLIPFTFALEPTQGLLLLGSVYVGSTYGGSISAILFNTPGSPEAACTALDGHPMAKQGQAGRALGIALSASAIGGIFGTLALMLLAPPLARVALSFGPAEYFALATLGITAIASIGSGSFLKGILSGLIGIGIATVGADPLTGIGRFTFGNDMFLTGVGFVPAIIGLFALSEVLERFSERGVVGEVIAKTSTKLPSIVELITLKWTLLRSSFIGLVIGILPGVGATTASFIGYSEAVRWSKTPEKFGKGAPEGIAAPESANNSAVGGAMIPLLALGIPGSATTAVMLGGLTIHGIVPGPLLMLQNKELVFSVFVGMMLANLLMIVFGLKAATIFAKVLDVPYALVGSAIAVFCITGVYALNNNMIDIAVMLSFGAFGFFLKKFDVPIAPLIIGMVLGPIAETNLRRALILSDFRLDPIISSPLSASLLILSVVSLMYGFYGQYRRFKRAQMQMKRL